MAVSLPSQGKHVQAENIERELLVSATRMLGAEHENTLISAKNLAVWLLDCGQKTEGEQFLRDTPALFRRTLGSNHEQTQSMLWQMRAHGSQRDELPWMGYEL